MGCAIEILNTLGQANHDVNALVVEFGLRNIPFRNNRPSSPDKGQRVGLFIPDLIAFDAIVADTKVIDQLPATNVNSC